MVRPWPHCWAAGCEPRPHPAAREVDRRGPDPGPAGVAPDGEVPGGGANRPSRRQGGGAGGRTGRSSDFGRDRGGGPLGSRTGCGRGRKRGGGAQPEAGHKPGTRAALPGHGGTAGAKIAPRYAEMYCATHSNNDGNKS